MEPEAYEEPVVFEMLNRLTGAGKPGLSISILAIHLAILWNSLIEPL
jgi:hypothetical protein